MSGWDKFAILARMAVGVAGIVAVAWSIVYLVNFLAALR